MGELQHALKHPSCSLTFNPLANNQPTSRTWPVEKPPMTAVLGAVMEVSADREEAPLPLPLPPVLPLVVEPPLEPCSAALVAAVPSAFWAEDSAVRMHMPGGEGEVWRGGVERRCGGRGGGGATRADGTAMAHHPELSSPSHRTAHQTRRHRRRWCARRPSLRRRCRWRSAAGPGDGELLGRGGEVPGEVSVQG